MRQLKWSQNKAETLNTRLDMLLYLPSLTF